MISGDAITWLEIPFLEDHAETVEATLNLGKLVLTLRFGKLSSATGPF